ncbi:MAG: hypothetical protein ABI614_24280 [Planctomycetota bacterium]
MHHQPPSQVRVSLLLVGSVIAGMLVSSALGSRVENWRAVPLPRTEPSLAVESP